LAECPLKNPTFNPEHDAIPKPLAHGHNRFGMTQLRSVVSGLGLKKAQNA
jgi:hypothetical protein